MPRDGLSVSETGPADRAAVLELYPQAFPDEDQTPLVSALLDLPAGVLSLAAWQGGVLAGHCLFTEGTAGAARMPVALLGPLCVAPDHQRQGVGTVLVTEGFARLGARGIRRVLVLGDPAYYGRIGFRPEPDIRPPYDLPAEWQGAWQSKGLAGDVEGEGAEAVSLPAPWMQPALWLP
ncbi:GNAT family N-acetyltransferase [Zhengella mangrovi]|uniref:GNAT family N-acetyltransferase n=1 Tax=Zhengella mangrovi TaxID=1982044 RepID=A0A2G1QPB9_9HYPH|nr:N-acetyltransferase [Zhengella mangrovi]PHP67363.1 GNAT family N-acetyltransferase [Zhengella mangrovi]